MLKNTNQRLTPRFTSPINDSDSLLSCFIAYNQFGGYCIPKSSVHRPAVQAVLEGHVWEKETIEFITNHIGTGDIVHAGTYFGDFLPRLSATCSQETKIWAFEPNPENHQCASITILLNKLENVSLTNAGLGVQEERVTMITKDPRGKSLGGASHIIHGLQENADGIETIQIVAIDKVIPEDRNISIIQLDVEGYEKEALMGGLKTIRRSLPILILETLPDEPWFSDSILSLGYTITGKINANQILTNNRSTTIK